MQSSNPFENSGSSGGGGNEETKDDFVLLKKDEDPTIQSTLIKRLDSIQQQDHLKKKQDLLDTKSNESSSICGASPFEVSKEDHSSLKSANDLKQQRDKQKEKQKEKEKLKQEQSNNETISLPFSNNNDSIVNLNNQQSTEIINNNNNNNINNNNINNNNNNNNDQFVSVPFSPPLKPFSLEKQESNSELPFIRPDNYESTNYPHNTTTTSNTGILNPGIDRAYYNMNSRIGSNIPLDDDNANSNPFTRITTAVDPEVEVNNDDDEAGPMVNININPGTFAEPNGAEVPVVTRRRRTDDKIGVIIMCTIILIIVGGCIAFLFI
ncbi:hypothetical protein ACTFIZ_007304 [Dictyostelium cf. discoideum]